MTLTYAIVSPRGDLASLLEAPVSAVPESVRQEVS